MRILIINQYFYPDISATSQIITELAVGLSKYFDIEVLCGKPSYNPIELTKPNLYKFYDYRGCKILRVWNTTFERKSFTGRILNYLTYIFFASITSIFLKGVDICIAMTDPPFAAFIALVLKKIKSIPYIVNIRDLHPEIELTTGLMKNSSITSLWQKLNLSIFRNALLIIVLGEKIKKYLMHQYKIAENKILVIPDFSEDEIIMPIEKNNKFLKDKEFKDKFIIMHSGNMGLNQDLPIIIEAANILKEYGELSFVLIGDGAMKKELMLLAKKHKLKNVYFLPYQKKEDLIYSLTAADVHLITLKKGLSNFILPSKIYGIMAAGRPMIACIDEDSDVAAIIKQWQCGITVEPGNPYLLAEAILKLYSCRSNELLLMGQNARRCLDLNFKKEFVINAYKNLISKIK